MSLIPAMNTQNNVITNLVFPCLIWREMVVLARVNTTWKIAIQNRCHVSRGDGVIRVVIQINKGHCTIDVENCNGKWKLASVEMIHNPKPTLRVSLDSRRIKLIEQRRQATNHEDFTISTRAQSASSYFFNPML